MTPDEEDRFNLVFSGVETITPQNVNHTRLIYL